MTRLLPLLTLLALLAACSDDTTESCFDDPTIPECVASCMEDPTQAFCNPDDMGVPEDGPMRTDMGPCGDCGDQLCDEDSGECVDCLSASDCTTAEASACGDDGTCEVCAVDDECGHDGLPGVCVEDEGCFECDVPNLEAIECSVAAPICDATDRSCRACVANAECASGLCIDGGCPAAADVVWVDGDDDLCDDGGSGAMGTPFCDLPAALDAGAAFVAVRDSTTAYGPISWTGGETVSIIAVETGGAMARIFQTGTGAAAVAVECSGSSTLTIVGLAVEGNSSSQEGVFADDCTLTLTDVSVSSNGQAGVSATGGTVTLTDVSVSSNGGVGVAASAAGDVTIRRCTVQGNDGGGLSLNGVRFDVENTVIGGPGPSANGNTGAIIRNPMTGSSFVNNTVVNNFTGDANASGVDCNDSFAVENSLLWNNTGGAGDVRNCDVSTSSEGTDPMFDTDGIHLTSSSACCVDTADDDAAPADDIDGDERPCGAGADIGADELCP